MTFYEWLRRQREREDCVGDVARDVFWDREAPKNSEDPNAWRAYAERRALPFLLDGLELAWLEFERR